MFFKVRQGSIFKTVRDSRATYSLLSHTGDHLRDINEGSYGKKREMVHKGYIKGHANVKTYT